jgi:hypothetical protein
MALYALLRHSPALACTLHIGVADGGFFQQLAASGPSIGPLHLNILIGIGDRVIDPAKSPQRLSGAERGGAGAAIAAILAGTS